MSHFRHTSHLSLSPNRPPEDRSVHRNPAVRIPAVQIVNKYACFALLLTCDLYAKSRSRAIRLYRSNGLCTGTASCAAILWRNSLYIESQLRAFCMYKLSADMPASPFSPTACTQNRALTAFVCTSCSPYNLPRAIDSFPQVRCGACLRTPNQIPDRNAWRIRK